MQVQTLRCVPFTEVLSRLPDEVDHAELVYYFSETTDYAYGTNSHTLVPWTVLVDDLTDCCIELGYEAPDRTLHAARRDAVLVAGEWCFSERLFVDLEN